MNNRPRVVLLTDFGLRDSYVAAMKGVITTIAGDADTVDLSHDIEPGEVRAGAYNLLTSYRYFPSETVFCCVIDPLVGSERRALAAHVEADARTYRVVCPDNGLLTPLLPHVRHVVTLDRSAFHLEPVSHTFHGRDVFAPVAAHLALGKSMDEVGTEIAVDALTRLAWPQPRATAWGILGEVIYIDRFGNAITNIPRDWLDAHRDTCVVTCKSAKATGIHRTFADVNKGKPVAYVGSSHLLELAVNGGSAAAELSVSVGATVTVEAVGSVQTFD